MAWITPRVWSVGELLTAAHMNTYLSDNLSYLFSAVSSHFTINLAGCWPSTTTGASFPGRTEMATNKENLNPASFVNGSKTYVEVNHALPGDYNGGTLTAQYYWTANSTSANAVIFGLQGRAYADNDAIDQAFGTAVEVTDNNGSAIYTQRISPATAAITLAGAPAAKQMCRWRAYRLGTGSDNLAVPALVESILVSYTRS
jgi:hypothetical protein